MQMPVGSFTNRHALSVMCFHGQGNAVGPELTGYDRKNLSFLLPAIIDPSLALREEYELVTLQLRPAALDDEGPTLSGFVTHLADQTLTLKDLGGNETVIRLADIASREHSSTCLLYTSPSPRDKRQSRMPSSA